MEQCPTAGSIFMTGTKATTQNGFNTWWL